MPFCDERNCCRGWHEVDELVHLPLCVSLRVTAAEEAFRAEVMVLPDAASDASQVRRLPSSVLCTVISSVLSYFESFAA